MAETLDVLGAVQRQLSDAVERLRDASARSAVLAEGTNWRTEAATAFHTTADAWRLDVARLAGIVEDARGEVGTVRVRLEVRVWGHGL